MSVQRVALVCFHTCPNTLIGKGKAGGMNVYVRQLAHHLGAMGIQVDVFTRCHAGQEADTVEADDNVRIVHLYGGPDGASMDDLVSYLPQFADAVLAYGESDGIEYQMVHSHYWLSGWVGRKVASQWGVPHAVTFHTLAEIKKQARSGEREHRLRATVERDLMASAQLVMALSAQEKESMRRLYQAPEERISIVPCGVDLSLFRPLDMSESRRKLGLNGERLILYVGRIEPLKGLDLLCRAAAMLDEDEPFKVLIVGGDLDSEEEISEVRNLGQGLGISDSLQFMGRIDQDTLPFYYSAADVCVVPSYYESFSLVALEAMACGTPVVGCRVGGLPTVVQHGQTGYLHSWRCPEPFADSLEVLLASTGLKRSMGDAGRKRAEGMGWDRVAADVLELYESNTSTCASP